MAGIEEYIGQAEAAFEADARKRRARQRVTLVIVLLVLVAAGVGIALVVMTEGDDSEEKRKAAEKLVAEAGGPDFEVKVRQLAELATSEDHGKEVHEVATRSLADELQKLVGDVTLAGTSGKRDLLDQSCRRLRVLVAGFFVDHPDKAGAVSLDGARDACRPAEVFIP